MPISCSNTKPNLKLEREDKKVVVNNAGEVLSTETEGHDGIVIADGADTEVGARLAQVLATGTGSVNVDGKVDPKQEVKVTHRVAIDLTVSSMPMRMTRWSRH